MIIENYSNELSHLERQSTGNKEKTLPDLVESLCLSCGQKIRIEYLFIYIITSFIYIYIYICVYIYIYISHKVLGS